MMTEQEKTPYRYGNGASRLLLGMLACLLLLTGCGSANDGELVVIRENVFLGQVREIYANSEDYLGKTIRVEGMYTTQMRSGEPYHIVYREDGCCGGMVGFEFTYEKKIPQDNDWIEVIGVLESFEHEGEELFVLRAKSVKVLSERGKEAVTQ